jgi:hypothetical protein
MKPVSLAALVVCLLAGLLSGQNPLTPSVAKATPRLIRFSGSLRESGGTVCPGSASITFALYAGQQGGSPLWLETQAVACDESGSYTALLGSTTAEGLPLDLFANDDERWLGVRAEGQEEQPRVLLVSVPYALRAEDANTVGGMTPQQIVAAATPIVQQMVLQNTPQTDTTTTTPSRPSGPTAPGTSSIAAPGPRISTYLKNSTQGEVEAYNDGTSTPLQLLLNPLGGNVGVGTTAPGQKLSVAGTIESTTGGFKFPDATTQATAGISQTTADTRYAQLGAANTFTGNVTISNDLTATTSNNATATVTGSNTATSGFNAIGVEGLSASSSGIGVEGVNSSGGFGVLGQSSSGNGVYGQSSNGNGMTGQSASGYGVVGASGSGSGVFGTSNSGYGVYGLSDGSASGVEGESDGGGPGVYGTSSGVGVQGVSNSNYGVEGQSTSSFGVYGQSSSGDGVHGQSSSAIGVYGESTSNYALAGESTSGTGVLGLSEGSGSGVYGQSTSGTGVEGESTSSFGVHGTTGASYGVYGEGGSVGVVAHNTDATGGNFAYLGAGCCAADLYGNVAVHGTLTKTAGSFKIDDPIDPANKYLSHSFVESPDMMNIYNGNIVTDGSGIADVTLPDWFSALNKDFRYQLTVIGVFAQAIIEQEITDNHFRIRTNQPNVKVSWQVTGVRHDPYAEAHRIPVVEDKPVAEKGTYQFPELYGQPAEKSLKVMRYPQKENSARTTAKPVLKPPLNSAVNPR